MREGIFGSFVSMIKQFKYDYDKKDLLERVERAMPKVGMRLVRSDEKSNAGGQDCWRIRVNRNLDDEDCKHIYDVCKPIIDFFGSKDNHVRVQYYDSSSYLGWHYDDPKGSGITKVNLLLTEVRPFVDKYGKEYEFDTCIVNATMFEHQFDNRGLPTRCFIRIGLQDVLYEDAVNKLGETDGYIQAQS